MAFQIRHLLIDLDVSDRRLLLWSSTLRTPSVGGGLKPPGGGPPPPTHPWRSGKSVIDVLSWQVFDVYGFFCRKSRKNRPKTLQNRGPGPPKSSLEPSKTPFFNTFKLRRHKKRTEHFEKSIFRPTWLHLGGPRGSKIEAKTRKNQC